MNHINNDICKENQAVNIVKKAMLFTVLLGALAFAAPEIHGKDAPWLCECACAKCPPRTILSQNKAKEFRYRTCFRDANNNGKCDNSSKDKGKCQNDCVAVDTSKGDKKKVLRLPCEGCPCAGNCTGCTFAPKN